MHDHRTGIRTSVREKTLSIRRKKHRIKIISVTPIRPYTHLLPIDFNLRPKNIIRPGNGRGKEQRIVLQRPDRPVQFLRMIKTAKRIVPIDPTINIVNILGHRSIVKSRIQARKQA